MNDSIASSKVAQSASPGRRSWLLRGMVGAATLGGFSLAWYTYRPAHRLQTVESSFWELEFPTPTGQRLRLDALRGKPLVLNFWATWCPPCIEELPLLSSFYREQSANNWQVLGLAIDDRDAVQRFLAQNPVMFPVVMGGAGGLAMSKSLGNSNGALPYTVVINPIGQIVQRKMGRLSTHDLRAWASTI